MNKKIYEKYLVSPITKKPLHIEKKIFTTDDKTEKYDVVKNVPVLLANEEKSEWHRELIEAILWEHKEEITKMYKKVDWNKSPVPIYIEYIKKLVGGKKEIKNALLRYSESNTENWIADINTEYTIKKEQIKKFKKYTSKGMGKYRIKKIDKSKHPYKEYANRVIENSPKTILELSTGAGSGTSAVARVKDKDAIMFSVDIGFECNGNTIGIGKFLKCRNTLLPVVANFWYLPFSDNTFDCVCSNCGLDESRENNKTIKEATRVLKSGGRFVTVSRKNAFMRQNPVLEPFGFSKEEIDELMKKCRLYSGSENLKELCSAFDLKCISQEDFETAKDIFFTISVFEKL